MGVYYANLSIVQFRDMMLGIHVYVYIGYMVVDNYVINIYPPQISRVRQLIKPNIIGTEYFKHDIYSLFFSLQNAVGFIILTYLVPVLFTFYIFIQQI